MTTETQPAGLFHQEQGLTKLLDTTDKRFFKDKFSIYRIICDFSNGYHWIYYFDIFHSRQCQTESYSNRLNNKLIQVEALVPTDKNCDLNWHIYLIMGFILGFTFLFILEKIKTMKP